MSVDLTTNGLRAALEGALNAERLVNGDGTVRLNVATARAILAALSSRQAVPLVPERGLYEEGWNAAITTIRDGEPATSDHRNREGQWP